LSDGYFVVLALFLPEADAPPRSLLEMVKFEASSKIAVLSPDCEESNLLSNTILSFRQ
jgi:hypothetical protein